MNSSAKRRNVFINKRFQARFMVAGFTLILLSGVCSALLIYWMTNGDLQSQAQSAHASIVSASERLGVSVLLGNVVAILMAGAIAVMAILYASHKIAGPLHRFKILCQDVGNGNFDTVTQLRESDQLQDLAVSFAAMVASLRENRNRQANILIDIEQLLTDLKTSNNLTNEQYDILLALSESVTKLKHEQAPNSVE